MLKNSAGGGTDQRRAGWFHTILAGVRVYQRQPDARTFDKSRWGLSYTAGLSLELATLLQTSAWEAAQDYASSLPRWRQKDRRINPASFRASGR